VAARSPLDDFREVWLVDGAAPGPPGERASPACLAARELRSGRVVRLDRDALPGHPRPPYATDDESLLVAFGAPIPLGAHLALGWPLPARVLDLRVEFRNRTNGLGTPHGSDLFGALAWYSLDAAPGLGRPELRDLRARGGPPTVAELGTLLHACEARVAALAGLLRAMLPEVDLGRALLRGRYTAAVARMELVGVPIDVPILRRLRAGWRGLQADLIRDVDARYGVFDNGSFSAERWEAYLEREGIAWPRLPSGAPALDDDTFREMARSSPCVAPMRELRHALGQLRLADLAVGSDGRNRVPLRPFAARTGRNQPSSSQFIFGPSRWLRGLIRPEAGRALAYIDWSTQEIGIAAALSGDPAMIDAYRSGDPYLALGKRAGRIPAWGTRRTHGAEREAFKACALGVLYGMRPEGLAGRIGQPTAWGRELIAAHKAAYPRFWRWSDAVVQDALASGRIRTVFGWTLRVGDDANPRSLMNFPCQANGAEMLRLACCLATERGIEVVAPVHDAVMVEGPAGSIDEVVAATQDTMAEASEIVLDGFRLRTEAKEVRWPERYMDERGREFWNRVMGLLPEAGGSAGRGRVPA
jgi:hypothetical protein